MKNNSLLLLLFLALLTPAAAQTQRSWEPLLASMLTAEDMETDAWEDTYELLCELEQQPLNLNTATREQLEQLPFLSAQQVEAIVEYLYHYAPMKSMNELRMIRALDVVQIELLHCFTCVGYVPDEQQFPSTKDIVHYGRQKLMADLRVPLYKRAGDRDGYLGPPYRHTLRYQFSYGDYVKLGGIGAQDAGEPFFANRNKTGYDFYSYYLQLKHLGRLETLVVGKYKLSAGMGLVLNNSFGMGKLATLQQMGRHSSTVRPHTSRSSAGYFTGVAATVSLSKPWQLTGFVSYRPTDATLNTDGTARTLLTDGYHRTAAEMEKKSNTHAADAGARVAFRHGRLHLGATAVYTHLSRRLQPDVRQLYRVHYAQGNDFLNLSADYGFLHHRLALNGETAINRQGAIATINNLSVNVTDGLSLLLLQRFFSYNYTALHARTVSEGGRVQNESGIYAGLSWQPLHQLRFQAYTDYAYFAWARYQVSQSSHAWDNLLTATYTHRNWQFAARYRLHLRQKDDETKTALNNETEQRARLAVSWQTGTLSSTTQADAVSTTADGGQRGVMLSEAVQWQTGKVKLNMSVARFNTDSYAARLYVYERGPLYSFAFPAYYGRGWRLAFMAHAAVTANLSLTAKAGCTRYTDRDVIGSGLQQINAKTQSDLDVQMIWKF